MECVSQSLASYSLLRCIVSAAQFAGGELTFSNVYAELVAMDAAGETTTPLRIQYDELLHFRVVRQQHLMRIELPRKTVLRWAEANGFAVELNSAEKAGNNCGIEQTEDSSVLIQQLYAEDMTHFLERVAPTVAASRRMRSLSRVSMTEPLPLSYCPPSLLSADVTAATPVPSEQSLATTAAGSSHVGDLCSTMPTTQQVDTARDDATAGSKSVSSASLLLSDRGTSPFSSLSNTDAPSSLLPTTGAEVTTYDPVQVEEGNQGTGAVYSEIRRQSQEPRRKKDTPSDSLEERMLSEKSRDIYLHRGAIATRRVSSLATASRGKSDSRDTKGRSPRGTIIVDVESESDASDTAFLIRRAKTKRCNLPSRESISCASQSRMGSEEAAVENTRGATLKRARGGPSRVPLRTRATRLTKAQATATDLAPSNPTASTAQSMKNGRASGSAAAQGKESGTAQYSAANKDASNGKNAEDPVSYNFADIITAPGDADHLPMTPAAKKLLDDLYSALPGRNRRSATKGAGAKSKPRPSRRATKNVMKAPEAVEEKESVAPPSSAVAIAVAGNRSPATEKVNPPLRSIEVLSPVPLPLRAPATSELGTPLLDPRAFYLSREAHRPAIHLSTGELAVNSEARPTKNGHPLRLQSRLPATPAKCVEDVQGVRVRSLPLSSLATLSPRSEYGVGAIPIPSDGGGGSDCEAALENISPSGSAGGQFPGRKTMSPSLLNSKRKNMETRRKDGHGRDLCLASSWPTKLSASHPQTHQRRRRRAKRRSRKLFPITISASDAAVAAAVVSSSAHCNSRKGRWRRVVRQLNSLSLYLAKARSCGEELRSLFLLMLDDGDV
uniref:Uncharacterized protein n=1 Tax=Trypanosoma congolense (strain IL3000) TaxID=1068625 RepID=G0UPX7_TRYCI|nr:conserved hypothetical protein [Trypanosoma congolense IL3000]